MCMYIVVCFSSVHSTVEGVVPGSGMFDVKLLKQGHSLGITINGGT